MKKSSYSKVSSFALLFVLTFVFCNSSCLAQKIKSIPIPQWVKTRPIPFDAIDSLNQGDILFDYSALQVYKEIQINVDREERFIKTASKVIKDSEVIEIGLKYSSKDKTRDIISITICERHNEKELINKINWSEYEENEYVANRLWESSNAISFSIDNLTKGDIYSYSYLDKSLRKDANLSEGLFYSFNDSLNIYFRVISSIPLNYKTYNGFPDLIEIVHDDYFEYIAEGLTDMTYKDITPNSFIRSPFVVLSKYKKLEDVGMSFKDQFLVNEKESKLLLDELAIKLTKGTTNNASKIQQIINYVQDSLIYQDYGLIRVYQPAWCIQGNRADCKAKTLIAIELLNRIGIDAQPVLVHSPGYLSQLDTVPSLHNFNHVILQFSFQGQKILIDPTNTAQTDKIGAYPMWGYGKGLVMYSDKQEIINITNQHLGRVEIYDEIRDRVKRKIVLTGSMAEKHKNFNGSIKPKETLFDGRFPRLNISNMLIHEFGRNHAEWSECTQLKERIYDSISQDSIVLYQELYSIDSIQRSYIPSISNNSTRYLRSRYLNVHHSSNNWDFESYYSDPIDTLYQGPWLLPLRNQLVVAKYHKKKIPLEKINLDTFNTVYELRESFGYYSCNISEDKEFIIVKQEVFVSGELPYDRLEEYDAFEIAIDEHKIKVHQLILAKDLRSKSEIRAEKKQRKKWNKG